MKTGEEIALGMNKIIMECLAEKPTLRLLDLDSLSPKDVMAFLRNKHSEMWGTFNITDDRGLENACVWFQVQMWQLHEFLVTMKQTV